MIFNTFSSTKMYSTEQVLLNSVALFSEPDSPSDTVVSHPKKRGRKPGKAIQSLTHAEPQAPMEEPQQEETSSLGKPQQSAAGPEPLLSVPAPLPQQPVPNQVQIVLPFQLLNQVRYLARSEGLCQEDMIIDLVAEALERRAHLDARGQQGPSHLMTRNGYVNGSSESGYVQPQLSHHSDFGRDNGNRNGSHPGNRYRSQGSFQGNRYGNNGNAQRSGQHSNGRHNGGGGHAQKRNGFGHRSENKR